MTPRRTFPALALGVLVLVGAAVPAAPAAGADLSGGLSAEQLWAQNVFGTEISPADAVLDGRGWLAWYPDSHLRAGASGRLVRFLDDPRLDHDYLQGSVEAQWAGGQGRRRLTGGVSGIWRSNTDLYTPYDYRDVSLFASGKLYFTPAFTFQARADLAQRVYPEMSWEDARRVWLSGRLNRSLPTRTSLTLSGRVGWKDYEEAVPDTAGLVGDAPQAALWEVAVQVGQSLSERVGARAWLTYGRLFEATNVARQLTGFENPLLDEFSADGERYGGALKVILPWNCTTELAGEYINLYFPGEPSTRNGTPGPAFIGPDDLLILGQRHDTVTRVKFYADKRITGSSQARKLTLRASAEWTRQESTELYWTWQGWTVGGGLSFEF